MTEKRLSESNIGTVTRTKWHLGQELPFAFILVPFVIKLKTVGSRHYVSWEKQVFFNKMF